MAATTTGAVSDTSSGLGSSARAEFALTAELAGAQWA
jgi:hypothetical protein